MVDLGEADRIDGLIAAYRQEVTGEGRQRSGRLEERASPGVTTDERDAGVVLREAVFDRLRAAMDLGTRLFIGPDGDLTRLPFEVLPGEGGRRLIEDYVISYLSTGRDLLRFGAPGEAPGVPLVVAAPDFDLGASEGPSGEPSSGSVSEELDRSTLYFEPLAGTATEGRDIGVILGVSPWLGAAVLEGPLKEVRSPRIFHMATHGFFLPDQPKQPQAEGLALLGPEGDTGSMRASRMENPLLRSGLALAGANTFLKAESLPLEAEDGLITAEDVSGLDLLGTELVVLSACETGLGEVRVGEGVFGLRRAFVLAGARTLVMSLWKVPDDPSADLMRAFYENLRAGMGRAEALRKAQLALAKVYPPPWFWGAFICQGDPGPLELAPP
jgi:CHAT domain-containing protein